jgi:hypothetical protein
MLTCRSQPTPSTFSSKTIFITRPKNTSIEAGTSVKYWCKAELLQIQAYSHVSRIHQTSVRSSTPRTCCSFEQCWMRLCGVTKALAVRMYEKHDPTDAASYCLAWRLYGLVFWTFNDACFSTEVVRSEIRCKNNHKGTLQKDTKCGDSNLRNVRGSCLLFV